MTLREIRIKAAEILEAHEDAWCQGSFRHMLAAGRYSYCLIGACYEAAGYWLKAPEYWSRVDLDAAAARTAAYDAATAALGPNISISEWNDTPGRTREEVIAALRAV